MQTLSELAFHILLALGDGPSHGYAIGKEVEERSGGRLDPATGALYQACGDWRRNVHQRWTYRPTRIASQVFD